MSIAKCKINNKAEVMDESVGAGWSESIGSADNRAALYA
jgi:hypothetical protein